jgi:hypothetical protein
MPYTKDNYCEVRIGLGATTITSEGSQSYYTPDDVTVEITDVDGSLCGIPVHDMVDAWFKVNRDKGGTSTWQEPRPVEPGQYGRVVIKEGHNTLTDCKEWIASVDYPGHARRYSAHNNYVNASRWTETALLNMWINTIDKEDS